MSCVLSNNLSRILSNTYNQTTKTLDFTVSINTHCISFDNLIVTSKNKQQYRNGHCDSCIHAHNHIALNNLRAILKCLIC